MLTGAIAVADLLDSLQVMLMFPPTVVYTLSLPAIIVIAEGLFLILDLIYSYLQLTSLILRVHGI